MKFSELPVGTVFVFEGERYNKVSPLMAHHVVTGASRLMHRSATVADAVGEASPAAQQSPPESLPTKRVIAAFDEFCLGVAKAAEDSGADGQKLRVQLEDARGRFLRSIYVAD
jgi:hypothetical protein